MSQQIKSCSFCKFFTQRHLDQGICDCSYNLDHCGHVLATKHTGCYSFEYFDQEIDRDLPKLLED